MRYSDTERNTKMEAHFIRPERSASLSNLFDYLYANLNEKDPNCKKPRKIVLKTGLPTKKEIRRPEAVKWDIHQCKTDGEGKNVKVFIPEL